MTIAVGIDPSSQRLVAVIGTVGQDDSTSVQIEATRLGASHDILERAQLAFQWADTLGSYLAGAAEQGEDVIIGIEKPLLGLGGANATITQSIVHGAVAVGLAKYGHTVSQVNNTVWKKNIVGNGNANKAFIASWCKDEHPAFYAHTASDKGKPDQDAIDAMCIWLNVCRTVEVLAKLDLTRARVRRTRVGGRQ